jgi:hypothetical protein
MSASRTRKYLERRTLLGLAIFHLQSSIFCCAQTVLTADGLAAYVTNTPVGGGGGGSACSSVVPGISGLVRYWALDEGSGTSAADSSGNSATGMIEGGPSWVAGKAGAHALSFSSRSQYATNRNTVTITSFTIAAWVNPSNLTGESGHNMIVSAIGANMWLEINSSGHPNFHTFANVDFTDTSTTLTTGSWHHIAATIDGADGTTGTVTIYVDGVQTFSNSGAVQTRTDSFAVSTYGPSVGNYGFIGTIDEIAIFNRALNSTEINSIATCN